MRRLSGCCFALFLLAGPALAAEKTKGVLDLWEAAYLKGGKTGYIRTYVVEFERDQKKVFRTTVDLNLTMKRFKDTIHLRMETGTEETADGKVTGVFMRQYLGKKQVLHLVGTVSGKELLLRMADGPALKPAPWNDKVVGLFRQQRLFKDRKVKPGDKFEFLSFEPSVNLVVTVRAHVKELESVTLPGSTVKKKLLRVDLTPEELSVTKSDGSEGKVQLPTLTYWLDKDLVPVRSQFEAPGLGTLTTYRTTQKIALLPGTPTTLDLGISQLVRIKKRIERPHDSKSAIYRITIKGDKDAASAFTQDGRQVVKNANGETFDLYVKASRGAREGGKERKVKEEFLKSNYFINSDDRKVKQLARKAAGDEKDPWKKALLIEKWVHRNMNYVNDEGLATADHVARTLEGDCTEYAMLTAAMCRAQGIPSRTAVGLVYADDRRLGPVMGFHMWTEVWVKGQWIPIDAILGQGYVGAAHLKILDHSWYDTRNLTPLLPFLRVVGKLGIEVVEVKGE
jgi:hypothetical protein